MPRSAHTRTFGDVEPVWIKATRAGGTRLEFPSSSHPGQTLSFFVKARKGDGSITYLCKYCKVILNRRFQLKQALARRGYSVTDEDIERELIEPACEGAFSEDRRTPLDILIESVHSPRPQVGERRRSRPPFQIRTLNNQFLTDPHADVIHLCRFPNHLPVMRMLSARGAAASDAVALRSAYSNDNVGDSSPFTHSFDDRGMDESSGGGANNDGSFQLDDFKFDWSALSVDSLAAAAAAAAQLSQQQNHHRNQDDDNVASSPQDEGEEQEDEDEGNVPSALLDLLGVAAGVAKNGEKMDQTQSQQHLQLHQHGQARTSTPSSSASCSALLSALRPSNGGGGGVTPPSTPHQQQQLQIGNRYFGNGNHGVRNGGTAQQHHKMNGVMARQNGAVHHGNGISASQNQCSSPAAAGNGNNRHSNQPSSSSSSCSPPDESTSANFLKNGGSKSSVASNGHSLNGRLPLAYRLRYNIDVCGLQLAPRRRAELLAEVPTVDGLGSHRNRHQNGNHHHDLHNSHHSPTSSSSGHENGHGGGSMDGVEQMLEAALKANAHLQFAAASGDTARLHELLLLQSQLLAAALHERRHPLPDDDEEPPRKRFTPSPTATAPNASATAAATAAV